MDLHSTRDDFPETRGPSTSPATLITDLAPPTTTLPTGPRRIRDRRSHRHLQRAGLVAAGGLAAGLLTRALMAAAGAPTMTQSAPWAHTAPLEGFLAPLLIAALGLFALWRLSAWLLPIGMAALLTGASLPLLRQDVTLTGLLASPASLGMLALPLLLLLMNRSRLRRWGLTGRLTHPRDALVFLGLAGIAAPALGGAAAGLTLLALGHPLPVALRTAAWLAAGWAIGLVSMGTMLQASAQRPRRGSRWPARLLAAGALVAVVALAFWPEIRGALLFAPHLLLALHSLQASPRDNARLGAALVGFWALLMPAWPVPLAAGLLMALLPLGIVMLNRHQLRDRDGWRTALDAQGLALAEWRLPEGRIHASARWLALTTPVDLGAPAGTAPLDWLRVAHPRDREMGRRALRELLGHPGNDRLGLQLRLAADGGDWCWHELQAHVPQRDTKGRARHVILTLADVSWRHTAEERERMSATLFQQSSEGLAIVDLQWRIVDVNPAYCELVHASREALVGRLAAPLSVANLQRSSQEPGDLQSLLNAGKTWSGQLQVALDDGSQQVFAARLSPVPELPGATQRWRLLSVRDLGETLRQQDMLRRSLRFDVATGLPNRDEFMRLMQQSMVAAMRDGYKLVIGIIDLDDFARINEDHGQLVADAVLLQLSNRLQSTLRSARGSGPDTADQLARLHGDEFAVVLRVHTPEEAQRAVERLLGLLSTPVAIRESRVGEGLSLEVGASMGATLYPLDDADPETLLRHADHALYRAKQIGRGTVQFHDPTLDLRDEAGLIALARIQRALDDDELLLYYQPQIDLRTGQVMGVEALLRWQHPDRGLLSPAHFLPQIAHTGLAVQIGDWVISQALSQAAQWKQEGLGGARGLPISVNVGGRQLGRPDFPQRLQELIQRQPAELAHLLHLDVLESDALAQTAAAQAVIQRCLALGVGVALDDFGAGYSRLTSLKRLPVDTLKLHRSYVQGMLGDAQDLSLVESVIGLARNIGCSVLAKGVESRAHARELLRLGCRLGQGHGIAAAMHPSSLPEWMAQFESDDWAGQLKSPSSAPQALP